MPILNVEDHAPSRFLRSRILERAGFNVVEEDTVRDAVATAVNGVPPPRLVLMDVGLPDGNGIEACERIKAARPTLPIVLVSAVYRTTHDRRDAFGAGADAYLVEPIAPEVLVKTIQQLAAVDHPRASFVPAVVFTTADGAVVSANGTAAKMLNIGERGMTGRNLLTFFDGRRAQLQVAIGSADAGQITELVATLRPKDRKPFDVKVDIARVDRRDGASLKWTIEPVSE